MEVARLSATELPAVGVRFGNAVSGVAGQYRRLLERASLGRIS
jgi:hypothetical protein